MPLIKNEKIRNVVRGILGGLFNVAVDSTPVGKVLTPVVKEVLNRQDVPIEVKDVPSTTVKVEEALTQHMQENNLTVAPVKSGWFSKINWFAFPLVIFGVFDLFGHPIPADVQDAVQKLFIDLAPIAIMYFRTFKTTSVVSSSLK